MVTKVILRTCAAVSREKVCTSPFARCGRKDVNDTSNNIRPASSGT